MRPLLLWEYQPWTLLTLSIILSSVKAFGTQEQYYPRPRFVPGESNFTFHQGDTATIICGVMHLGTKTVTWRRDSALQPLAIGEMIFSANTGYEIHHPEDSFYWNLLIKNVQPEHADTYECQISTRDKMKKRMYLNILDDDSYRKPVINISGLFHVDKGQSIKLRCNASGATAPPDVIDWFKDGLQLQSNDKKAVSITKQFSYADRTMTSVLEIQNAAMDDKGTYTCRTSDLQVTSVNVNILNAEKPKSKREKTKLQASTLERGVSYSAGCASVYGYSEMFQRIASTFVVAYLILWSRDTS